MSLVTVPIGVFPKWNMGRTTLGNSFRGLRVDAATEKIGFLIMVPKDGTIDQVGFRWAVVNNNPDNGVRVSLQDPAADGNPDGVLDQYRDIASGSVVTNTWVTTGLLTSDGTDTGTKRSVITGQFLYVVLEPVSFTAGDSWDLSVTAEGGFQNSEGIRGYQYYTLYTGTWGRGLIWSLNLGVRYSTGEWVYLGQDAGQVYESTTPSWAADTNPRERGMKFTNPIRRRVIGFSFFGQGVSDPGLAEFKLYDANDTVLASVTSLDYDNTTTGPSGSGPKVLYFSGDPVVIESDTTYRITCRPTVAGLSGGWVYGWNYPSVVGDITDASFWPSGTAAVPTTRNADPGAWTDGATRTHYAIGLLYDQIDLEIPGSEEEEEEGGPPLPEYTYLWSREFLPLPALEWRLHTPKEWKSRVHLRRLQGGADFARVRDWEARLTALVFGGRLKIWSEVLGIKVRIQGGAAHKALPVLNGRARAEFSRGMTDDEELRMMGVL